MGIFLCVLRGTSGDAGPHPRSEAWWADCAPKPRGGMRVLQPSEGLGGLDCVVPSAELLGASPRRRDLGVDGGCEDRTRLARGVFTIKYVRRTQQY